MSQLSSFLDNEVTKFRDIENILKKLKQDGEVESIFDILKGVFSNEFKFTTQELLRIENEKGEKINIQEQCQENLMMFKSNFQLIVQMIFDKAFKSAASENKVKLVEEGLTPAETTMESANASTISEDVSTKKKKAKKARSKSKRATSPKHSESNISLDPRTPSRKNKTKAKKDSTAAFTSPSRATSPLAKIFGTSASTRAGGSSFKERSSRRSSPHPNQSQTQSQLNISESYMSEFNHIRGPATFKRSPRASTSRNVSPGPGQYKVEPSSLRQSPSPTIDRATKKCWFDEIAQQNESPGPAKHTGPHYFLSK